MREVDDWIAVFIYLMENIISKQFDNIPVAGLGPSWLPIKPVKKAHVSLSRYWETQRQFALGTLIDETKLAE